MKNILITGSTGLVGSEAVEFFSPRFDRVIGIDNDLRKNFFGEDASTRWNRDRLKAAVPNYEHHDLDIRSSKDIEKLFETHGRSIHMIVHAAAQPSHDWAAKDPETDFTVNANGTLAMLEAARKYCPEAVFIFTSTNKVYGDTPNRLPLVEGKERWEVDVSHPYFKNGIDETMSIDQTKHSLFGASKVAADVLVQEYGRYFGMKTGVFRCGCITGPRHSGTQLHGFLSYLVKCAITGQKYTIFGYKGKQVRDNIHSFDLVNMFQHFYENPRPGETYNAGGSRFSNCSILEAVSLCESLTGKKMVTDYSEENRAGDHIWWISDLSKFKSHFPAWQFRYGLKDIVGQIHTAMKERIQAGNFLKC